MPVKKVFILTRPNNNKILSDKLGNIGFESLSLPSLRIVPLDLQSAPLPEIYDFIFFSSSNAVKYYLLLINNIYGYIKWPSSTIVVTVGAATANSIRSSDLVNMDSVTILSPDSSVTQLDSESLWDVLKSRSLCNKKFLFVRGTTGRDWLINKVSEYCEVNLFSVYSRDNIKWSRCDSEKLKAVSDSSDIVTWLFTSVESIEATVENIALLNLSDWFSNCCFIVTHRRIYNFLFNYFLELGVSNEVVIKECLPYNESIVATCESI